MSQLLITIIEEEHMIKWIEEHPDTWTYQLKCPYCGFCYSPHGYEDGTTAAPYKACPNCGEKMEESEESEVKS